MKNNFTANISLKNCILPMILVIISISVTYTPFIASISNTYLSTFVAQIIRIIFWLCISFFSFRMFKGITNGIKINEEKLEFHGELKEFLKITLIYGVLNMITFGLALPLFMKKKYEYIVANISYKGQPFQFQGGIKAMIIFVFIILGSIYGFMAIIWFGIYIPFPFDLSGEVQEMIALLITVSLILITTTYLIHWYARIGYGNYKLGFKDHYSTYIPFMLLWLVVSSITLGLGSIFMGIWILKTYIRDLEARSDKHRITFSEDLDIFDDGFYIIGQMLVTIITLGIYTPMAYQRVLNRFLPKIYYTKEY
ncbi:DUF898 family protein [Prolixibacteraceae bacterium]|nr:DUF898 family protein [Prolixibacteraceae bacterium]